MAEDCVCMTEREGERGIVRDFVSLIVLFTDKNWRELWVGERQQLTSSNFILIIMTAFLVKCRFYFYILYSVCLLLLRSEFCILLLPPPVCLLCSAIYFCFSLNTPLLPNSLTSMCPLGLRTSVFPDLAEALMVRRARKANMTGSRQGGLLQAHHWEGGKQNRRHGYKLTWVWSKCHPNSVHSSLHSYYFQMAYTVFCVH